MFTNNIGKHETCYHCGKPIHQYGDPPRQKGDNYCDCTKEERAAAIERGIKRGDISKS